MKRQLINLRLPPELVARVDAQAKELGQTRTMFIERALERALTDADSPGSPAAGAKGLARALGVPVKPARELLRDGAAMDRQARLNAARSKKR